MAAISLRRTKEMSSVGLPLKTIETHHIELSAEERKMYDEAKEEADAILLRYGSSEGLVYSYSAVISMILRLRQICTDFALCPSDFKSHLLPSSDIEGILYFAFHIRIMYMLDSIFKTSSGSN